MMYQKIPGVILFILFCFYNTSSLAITPPIKFGEIPIEDLKMTHYPSDSSAVAAVLCDYGNSIFFADYYGFVVDYQRISRIKILNKDGYKYANFKIPIFNDYEELNDLEAFSYTLEDGTIHKHEIKKSDIFKLRYNDNWDVTKFEVPNVKVGTVIEVKYKIRIKRSIIRNWAVQWEIPVRQSQYAVAIPEYFMFDIFQKGKHKITSTVRKFEVSTIIGTYWIKYIDFKATDIPAFQKESHITSITNHLLGIEFELRSYKGIYGDTTDLTESWKSISTNLFERDEFGDQLDNGDVLEKVIETIKANHTNNFQRIKALYEHIKKNMAWNGNKRVFSESIEDAWGKKIGSSADINLLLIAGLRTMGYKANPVLLSTRSNGFVHQKFYLVSQFNYVIASVTFNNKSILLDATDKFMPAGILPSRCLNYHGRLIDENGGEWVDLSPRVNFNKTYYVDLTLNLDGNISGKIKEISIGYAAIEMQKKLSNHNSVDDYNKEYSNQYFTAKLSLDSLRQIDPYKPLTLYYQFKYSSLSSQSMNLHLVNPFILGRIKENPFKLEKRDYPVEYTYPKELNYVTQIKLPEGYTVEELPAEQWIVLPENGGSLIFSVKNSGQILLVVFKFKINKTVFTPDEYDQLKQLYNEVIKIHNAEILLKKNT